MLSPQHAEDLPSILRDLGLVEISKSAWLKAPKFESAAELHDSMLRRLEEQPPSGAVADISILDPARAVDYYTGRWRTPSNECGEFVARRPQAYGSALWGFANLENGNVMRFLDFPLKGTRWRGCDVAWHLQMAIDQSRGTPQKYRKRPDRGRRRTSISSLRCRYGPSDACAVVGRSAPREHCLFSYWIPSAKSPPKRVIFRDISGCQPGELGQGERMTQTIKETINQLHELAARLH